MVTFKNGVSARCARGRILAPGERALVISRLEFQLAATRDSAAVLREQGRVAEVRVQELAHRLAVARLADAALKEAGQ